MRSKQTNRRVTGVTPLRGLALAVVALVVSAAMALPGGDAWAGAGDLLVSPVRVVLEGRTRSAQVTLVNKGTETSVFRVSMVNRRMLENGGFEAIEEPGPGELFAETLVRYAPRRITLEPDSPQTIRILLRKPADLAAAEYRSHMMFRAVPNAAGAQSVENQEDSGEGLAIKLTPIFGLTIPIIVRHGELAAATSLSEPVLNIPADGTGQPSLTIRLGRQGARSVYGDLSVSFADTTFGGQVIGETKGVAVYTPNESRLVRIALDPALTDQLKGQTLKVTFEEPDRPGNGATAELRLSVR